MPSDPDTQCCLSEASLGAHFKCHFSGCLLRPHSRARPSCCLPLLVYVCALCPGFPASSSFIISPLATRALSPALLSTSVPGLSTLSLLCCRSLLWLHSGLAPPRPRQAEAAPCPFVSIVLQCRRGSRHLLSPVACPTAGSADQTTPYTTYSLSFSTHPMFSLCCLNSSSPLCVV